VGSDEENRGPDLRGLRRLSAIARPPKRDRDIDLPRILAFLAAAAIVIAVPWFIVSRIGDTGPARPGRAARSSTATSPSPSPSQTLLADSGVYEVVGDVRCARIRLSPGTDREIINCVTPGVKLRSDGRLVERDGFTWLHVDDPYRKVDGWIATRYVKKVS
jgi:hypothetical protein